MAAPVVSPGGATTIVEVFVPKGVAADSPGAGNGVGEGASSELNEGAVPPQATATSPMAVNKGTKRHVQLPNLCRQSFTRYYPNRYSAITYSMPHESKTVH